MNVQDPLLLLHAQVVDSGLRDALDSFNDLADDLEERGITNVQLMLYLMMMMMMGRTWM